jgi:hypothetical protein
MKFLRRKGEKTGWGGRENPSPPNTLVGVRENSLDSTAEIPFCCVSKGFLSEHIFVYAVTLYKWVLWVGNFYFYEIIL